MADWMRILVERLLPWLSYVLYFNDKFEDLAHSFEEFERERVAIERFAEAAKRKLELVNISVLAWLEKANEIHQKAMELDEGLIRMNERDCFFGCFLGFIKLRCTLAREAMKLIESMDKLITEVPSLIKPTDVWAGTIYAKLVMDTLKKDRRSNIIAVCGKGSVMLTIIATELCKRAIEENAFDAVVMAAVSERTGISKIQGDLAEKLGFPFQADEVISIKERAKFLLERLMSADVNKNILVILDDVCTLYNLSDDIGIPVDMMSGCKVVLTSQSRRLCHAIGAKIIFDTPISIDDITLWVAFKEKVGDWAGIANWHSIARQFVDECDGKLENIDKLAKEMNRWIASIKESTQPSSPEHKPLSTSRFRQGQGWRA